jgi:hypothetical protein
VGLSEAVIEDLYHLDIAFLQLPSHSLPPTQVIEYDHQIRTVNKPFTTVYDCICTVYVPFFAVNQTDVLRPYFNGNTAVF